jgi:hypothetical protein
MQKTVLVAVTAGIAFAGVAAALLALIPEPVEAGEYLLAGSVATLVALLVVFFGLARRSGEAFFKKRMKRR